MPCAYCILLHMPNMDFGSRSHAGGNCWQMLWRHIFLGAKLLRCILLLACCIPLRRICWHAAILLTGCFSQDADARRGALRATRAEQNTRTMLRAKKPRLRPWHRKPKVGILTDMRNSHHVLLHHVLQRNSGSHQDTHGHQCDARRPTTIHSPGPHQVETPYSSTREVE